MDDREFYHRCMGDFATMWGSTPNSDGRTQFILKYACTFSLMRNLYDVKRALSDLSLLMEAYEPQYRLMRRLGTAPPLIAITDERLRCLLEIGVERNVRQMQQVLDRADSI